MRLIPVKLLEFLIFLIFWSPISQSQQRYNYPIDSLNAKILESLSNNKIVMVGDGFHAHEYYYDRLVKIIELWLNKLENKSYSNYLPIKLYLILEPDSTYILHFVNTINRTETLESYLTYKLGYIIRFGGWDQLSVDNIKFLKKLSNIFSKIHEINNINNSKDISLIIQSIEPKNPLLSNKGLNIGLIKDSNILS